MLMYCFIVCCRNYFCGIHSILETSSGCFQLLYKHTWVECCEGFVPTKVAFNRDLEASHFFLPRSCSLTVCFISCSNVAYFHRTLIRFSSECNKNIHHVLLLFLNVKWFINHDANKPHHYKRLHNLTFQRRVCNIWTMQFITAGAELVILFASHTSCPELISGAGGRDSLLNAQCE